MMERTRRHPQTDNPVDGADDANDQRVSGQTHSSRVNIVALEERVRIHQATLNAWRQRRDTISLVHERALHRKRALLQQRERLRDRQQSLRAAKGQHESLQLNLQESLAKSRERLQRLTRLEAMEEESFEDRDGEESIVGSTYDALDDQEDNPGGDVQNIFTKEPLTTAGRKENLEEDATGIAESNPDAGPNHIMRNSDSANVAEPLWKSWLSKSDAVEVCSDAHNSTAFDSSNGLALLPPLEDEQIGEYMTLSIREASALDLDEDRGKSLRRNLLSKTCLDVISLLKEYAGVPRSMEAKQRSKNEFDEKATVDEGDLKATDMYASSIHLNPNLSLCPYELSGICADDFCPYQHTIKATKVLARERLPLPSLSSRLLSREESHSAEHPVSQVVAETQSSRKSRGENVVMLDPNSQVDLDTGHRTSNEGGEDDEESFMELPVTGDNNDEDDDLPTDVGSRSSVEDMEEDVEKDDDEPLLLDAARLVNIPPQLYADSFPWRAALPNLGGISQSSETNTNDMKFSAQSLLTTLRDKYGILLTSGQSEKHDGVEIHVEPLVTVVSSPFPPCDYESLGRLMDASRLALHGGRLDIAITLCGVLRKGDVFDSRNNNNRFQSCFDFLEARIQDSWVCGCTSRALFSAHVSMAILSWSLADVRQHFADVTTTTEKEASIFALLVGTSSKCHRRMVKAAPSSHDSSDKVSLHKLLWRSRSDGADKTVGSNACLVGNNVASRTNAKLLDLLDTIVWSQKSYSMGSFDSLPASEQQLEVSLKALWLAVKKTLETSSGLYEMADESNQTQDRMFRGLKAVIIMGHAVFGMLGSFVSQAGQNEGSIESPRLSGSAQAAWTLLDGAIFQVLKEFRRSVAGLDLLELLLVPLFSASIASAVFLRNYSTAQRRLEQSLSRLHRTTKDTSSSVHRVSLLQFSEVLWSQIIQLRMTLPTQPISAVSHLKSSSKSEIKISPLDSSRSVQDETKMIVEKVQSLKIRLHNLSLWGDWNPLSLARISRRGRQLSWDWFPCSQDEAAPRSNDINRTLIWKTDVLGRLNAIATDGGGIHGRPAFPVPLSPLPLLLLHLGHHLTNLDLNQSQLECLPLSFGLYFPNLEILDLSFNGLTMLPESFQNMTHRMSHLKVFRAHHNRLHSLPDGMFSTMEAVLSSPHSPTLDSLLSPLTILDVSHNRLGSLPPLNGSSLYRLEELLLDHNALVETTVVDLSRLVTKLPTLRLLTYESQHVDPDD